jgi:hypothetical protein
MILIVHFYGIDTAPALADIDRQGAGRSAPHYSEKGCILGLQLIFPQFNRQPGRV